MSLRRNTFLFLFSCFLSLPCISHASMGSASSTTITIVPGSSDYTLDLKAVFTNAPDGSTIKFLKGTYPVAKGSSFVVYHRLNLIGSDSTLVNAHFLFLANVSINGLTLTEKDCLYKSTSPSACPAYPPMISLGAANYPITQTSISNVVMNYSRAYTGISFGTGPAENISITNFSIVDNELSGITALGGSNITISNGSITGSSDANVDDGIALYSAFSELSNVTISDITTNNTFDAVGVGTLMYFPMHDITMSKTVCKQTAVCIYVKAGDAASVPKQYSGYSTLDRFKVDGVTDTDPTGVRYLSTIWIYAKGGAVANDITIDNVNTSSRSASQSTPHIWLFTDQKSKINGAYLSNMSLVDRYAGYECSTTAKGQPIAEGVFIEDQGNGDIGTIALNEIDIDGAAYYAVDSSLAKVSGLSISNSSFLNINKRHPSWGVTNIPYQYVLNGTPTVK